MLTISLRRKVKTGRLRSCRRAADWLVPCIHLTLPVPPSLPAAPAPASTQLAASSRGSGEQFGGLGRAAEAMEASAGDDRDLRGPPPQRCRRGPNAKCGWGKGRLGGAAGAPSGQPALPAFRAAAAQLSAAGGTRPPRVPAHAHPPLSVCFPHRRRLLIWARQLQQRLQRHCAKPGRSGESRWRGCGGRVDSGEEASAEPGEGPRVLHRCGLRAGAARCGRIPQRTPAAEGLTVTHSYPPFISLHPSKRPTTATTLKFTS